ncbi:MAG: hypothetical protein AVDCRST_MAG55-723, partial [uncultured Rubrobacteraceae bacterium]
ARHDAHEDQKPQVFADPGGLLDSRPDLPAHQRPRRRDPRLRPFPAPHRYFLLAPDAFELAAFTFIGRERPM